MVINNTFSERPNSSNSVNAVPVSTEQFGLEVLAKSPLVQSLRPQNQSHLAGALTVLRYAKGEQIRTIEWGNIAFLIEGRACYFHQHPDSTKSRMSWAALPPRALGLAQAIVRNGGPSAHAKPTGTKTKPGFWRAGTDCLVYMLKGPDLRAMLRQCPRLATGIAEELSLQSIAQKEGESLLSLGSSGQRINSLMNYLKEVLDFPYLPHQGELAEMLGISRKSVQRAAGQLASTATCTIQPQLSTS